MMSIICVYNNKEILDEYLVKSLSKQDIEYELILVDNRNNEFSSAASALNYGARKAHGDYIIFAHQDINFTSNNWLKNTENEISNLSNVGIIGVAGKINDSLVYSNIKQGLNPVDVSPYKLEQVQAASTLDECILIVPKDVFEDNPFDEYNCDNWHLYGVDYVLSIKKKGFDAYLIPTMLEHRSKGASMSEGYYITLSKLQKKHFSCVLIRTCMGDWFTFIPVRIQRWIKKYKMY